MATPVMGAEDFSYVLQRRTGALAFLGACPPGENPVRAHACHSNRMTIDESAMQAGTAMYASLALEYLAAVSR
jgi:hippurate hydrolase